MHVLFIYQESWLKFSLFVILLSGLSFYSRGQETVQNGQRPKIALVLSGGGAKGFSHIGVLKVLEREGIPVDLIVGTSIGSLVGGVYALGYSAEDIESIARSQDWEVLLSDEVPRTLLSRNDQANHQRYLLSFPREEGSKLSLPQGVIRGQNVLNLFCGLAGNVPENADFLKFPIPYACIAADLETGKEVVLTNGFLPTAMFSSMAIPAAFQPSERDSLLLIDGGVVNNFPTDVAKRLGADIIIGVDIRGNIYERNELNSINNVVGQLVKFFDHSKDSLKYALCDIMIRPDITGYSMTSFTNEAVDTLIRRGEEAAESVKDQLQEIKRKYRLERKKVPDSYVVAEKWPVTQLKFYGNRKLDIAFLRKNMVLEIPGTYSWQEIKNSIDRLYGLGGFEKIYFSLSDNPKGKTLNLHLKSRREFKYNLGFKANTTDAAALLLNTTLKNYGKVLGLLSVSAELSANPGLKIIAESNKFKIPTVGLAGDVKFQNYNIYEKGDKIVEADLFYSSGSLYFYQPFLNSFQAGLGLQEEYYRGDIFSKSDSPAITFNDMDYLLTNAYAYLSFDNMDDFYFPSKGTNLYAEFSLLGNFKEHSHLSPALLLKMHHVFPVVSRTALLFDLHGRALLDAEYPEVKITHVGGESYSQYFNYHFPFVGLAPVTLAERYMLIGLTGVRFRMNKSQYASLLFNAMYQSDDKSAFKGGHMIYGGGIKYAIRTMFGPVDVTIGYSGYSGKPSFSANFGYWF